MPVGLIWRAKWETWRYTFMMCLTFLHHLPSVLLLEQPRIFNTLVTSLTSLEDMYEYVLTPKWVQRRPLSNTRKESAYLLFPIIPHHTDTIVIYNIYSTWSDKARYFSFPEKWKKTLTEEFSLLQRWSIAKSIIHCLFKSMCKKISKSVSSQKTTQTSYRFPFDQLFFL